MLTPRGEVLHVKHEAGEEDETLAIKKGLAALLAARLHHHSEQVGQCAACCSLLLSDGNTHAEKR